ncbi:MAG TPA: hypothetical protein VK250_00035 [Nitrososphaeraceae archaeon]|nr:hypothetical protein [Nitrososphaeraceae archaeon]
MFTFFTGVKLSDFDSIYREIESKCQEYEVKCLSKRKRIRKVGARNLDLGIFGM